MRTIKLILIIQILLIVIAGWPVSAKKSVHPSPDAVVANLYRQHKRQSPFFQTRSRALLDKYIDKPLGDLLWKDLLDSRRKNEVGVLDGDPLYNAQDMDIKNLSIHKASVQGGKAEVKVSFINFKDPHELVFELVLRTTGWKVSNIKYDNGTDLVGFFKQATP